MTSNSAGRLPEWGSAEHVPAEELLRRQGIRPIESVDELACPDLLSFEAWGHRVGLLPYDEAVAIKWGEIQGNAHLRAARGRSTTVGSPPCCLAYGQPLATFNTKDFADYSEHDGLRLQAQLRS